MLFLCTAASVCFAAARLQCFVRPLCPLNLQKKRRTIEGPHIRYTNLPASISVSLTEGIAFPLEAQATRPDGIDGIPQRTQQRLCEIPGCERPRAYACAGSGIGLCTRMACYKAANAGHDHGLGPGQVIDN